MFKLLKTKTKTNNSDYMNFIVENNFSENFNQQTYSILFDGPDSTPLILTERDTIQPSKPLLKSVEPVLRLKFMDALSPKLSPNF